MIQEKICRRMYADISLAMSDVKLKTITNVSITEVEKIGLQALYNEKQTSSVVWL